MTKEKDPNMFVVKVDKAEQLSESLKVQEYLSDRNYTNRDGAILKPKENTLGWDDSFENCAMINEGFLDKNRKHYAIRVFFESDKIKFSFGIMPKSVLKKDHGVVDVIFDETYPYDELQQFWDKFTKTVSAVALGQV